MYLEWNLRFNKKILKKGLELYGGYTDNCKELMGRQNVIYSFRCSGKEYIIRFSSSLRRSIMEIEAELDWIFSCITMKLAYLNQYILNIIIWWKL